MRRIKKADITFVSLVPRGANRLPVLWKDGDQECQSNPLGPSLTNSVYLGKAFEEEGLLTAAVYIPEVPDAHGDLASAEVIKQMAHGYAQRMGAVDVRHDTKALPREEVAPVESFIIQKGDPRFADLKTLDGKSVDATGGWGMVIKVGPENLRAKFRSGEWNGVSMYGQALVEEMAAKETLPDALAKRLGGNPNPDDNDMTPEELKKALEEGNKGLAETIVTGLVKALKPEPAKNDEPAQPKDKDTLVKFEGDPSNVDDVRKHQRKLMIAKVDWTDPKSVADYEAVIAKEAADAAAADEKNKSPELKAAEAELAKANEKIAKLKKASTQPTDESGDNATPSQLVGVSKEIASGIERGKRMAAFNNTMRGYGAPAKG